MRKLCASVLLAGISLPFIACGGGSSNNGGTGGNGGGGNPPPVTLSSITVSPATASIAPGTTAQFTAKGNFSDGSSKDLTSQVTWKSSAPSVATINFNGVIGLAKAVAAASIAVNTSQATSNWASTNPSAGDQCNSHGCHHLAKVAESHCARFCASVHGKRDVQRRIN